MYLHVHVRKVTALGVLCCFALFVCLTLLASFFLPSHLSFKNMYMYIVLYNLNTFNRLTYMYRVPTIYTTIFTYNCIQEHIIMIL